MQAFTNRRESSAEIAAGWPSTLILLGLSWILIIGLYLGTASSMAAVWLNSAVFAHGILILPISAYLVWLRRASVAQLVPVRNLRGLAVLTILALVWFAGGAAGVSLLQQLALVAMLQTVTWTLLGTDVVRALLFPLMYLFLAVPAGEDLTGPLQDFTAFFVVKALQLTGIPVLWEGRLITVSSGVWEVAEECSGVRYLIPAFALGCVYANLVYRRWARRLLFVIVFSLLPVIGNGIRAYGIVLLTHLGERISSAGTLARLIETSFGHLVYGWIVFTVVMFLLFRFGLQWREPVGQNPEPDGVRAVRTNSSAWVTSPRSAVVAAAASILLLTIVSAGERVFELHHSASLPASKIAAPPVKTSWNQASRYDPNWRPQFPGSDEERVHDYASGNLVVHLYLAHYANQERGELISSQNTIVPAGWQTISEGRRTAVVDGENIPVNEIIVRTSGKSRIIWNWYAVGGKRTSSPYYAKVLQGKARLFGEPQNATFFSVAADSNGGSGAVHTLQSFLNATSFRTNENSQAKARNLDSPETSR